MCGGFLDDAFDFIGDTFEGLGKTVEGALSGDFNSLLGIASLIPGPQQAFLLGANALNQLGEDNPLGAGLSALGAAGAGGALNDLGGVSGTATGVSPGATAALGDVSGLDGAWGTIGTGSDSLGDFLTQLPSGRLEGSGISGGASGVGNFLDTIGGAPLYDAFALGSSLPQMASALRGSPLTQTIGGLAKLYGGYTDYKDAQAAREAYEDNVEDLRTLYSPNSAYARQARKRIERRDAARGRNSQYGPREVELAALLADRQGQVLSSPGYVSQLGASRMRNAGLGGLLGGAGSLVSGLRGFF